MRVLITGGAGFIGSHIVEHFHDRHEVIVIDNLRTGYLRNLDGLRHEYHEVSITDRESLFPLFEGVEQAGLIPPESNVVFLRASKFEQQPVLIQPFFGQHPVASVIKKNCGFFAFQCGQ